MFAVERAHLKRASSMQAETPTSALEHPVRMMRERYGPKAIRVALVWARDLERQGYDEPARHWRAVAAALKRGDFEESQT